MGICGDFMGFYGILWDLYGGLMVILWDLMGWIPGTGVIWVKLRARSTGCTVGTRNGYGEDVFGGTCSELKHVGPCGYPILLQRYS